MCTSQIDFSLHAGRLRLVRLGRAHIHDVLVVDKGADVIGTRVTPEKTSFIDIASTLNR
jgi:hypothetical protein